MKKSTVRIYDTISKEYVDIEVSEEVYTYYNRSQWNMDDNDDSFYKHEIQFSALIGGNDGTFENFREFRIENSVEKEVISKLFTEKLYECLNLLSASDRQYHYEKIHLTPRHPHQFQVQLLHLLWLVEMSP